MSRVFVKTMRHNIFSVLKYSVFSNFPITHNNLMKISLNNWCFREKINHFCFVSDCVDVPYSILRKHKLWVNSFQTNISQKHLYCFSRWRNKWRQTKKLQFFIITIYGLSWLSHLSVGSNPSHDTCVLEQGHYNSFTLG